MIYLNDVYSCPIQPSNMGVVKKKMDKDKNEMVNQKLGKCRLKQQRISSHNGWNDMVFGNVRSGIEHIILESSLFDI